MPRTELIARQSAHPRGLLGEVVACAMAYDTARVNRLALDYLQPQPGDAILELGFGSGRAMSQVAARAREGFVAGIDPSEIMLRHARFRNGRYLREGRLELHLGEAAEIPYPEGRFDKAFAVHVLYFWRPDPQRELREIRPVGSARPPSRQGGRRREACFTCRHPGLFPGCALASASPHLPGRRSRRRRGHADVG